MNTILKTFLKTGIANLPFVPTRPFTDDVKINEINLDEINNVKLPTKHFRTKLNLNGIQMQTGWNLSKLDACQHFYVNTNSGEFYCRKCKLSGNNVQFKEYIKDRKLENPCLIAAIDNINSSTSSEGKDLELEEKIAQFKKSKPMDTLTPFEFHKLKLKNSLMFNQSKLSTYDVRAYDSSFLLPIYEDNDKTKKILDVLPFNDEYLRDYKNDKKHLLAFGLSNKSKKAPRNLICITDSILNAMTLDQTLSAPSIVINIRDISTQTLAILEDYNEIVIWLKNKKLSHELAKHLNIKRCQLISHLKSPYECMKLKMNIDRVLKEDSFPLTNDYVVKFPHLVEAIFNEVLHFEKYSGIKWKRLEPLNEILKGHRLGELTIFTGPTGSGKTTFLSEYSIDLATRGANTLWGSFEIQNHRLAKLMMTQYSGINMVKQPEDFKVIAKEFAKLPLYFMNFHGEETLDNVIKCMSHAVVMYNVNHVIIDNLQFMIGNSNLHSVNKFTQQDEMIGAFRRFATDHNCHVTIVIHPRKEDPNELLTAASIFGSAKATQEADNVIILQEQKLNEKSKIKYIQVTKNRFDGTLGKMMLHFDKERLSFSPKYKEHGGKSREHHPPDEDHRATSRPCK